MATWATETLKGPLAKQEAYQENMAPLIADLRALYSKPFQIGFESDTPSPPPTAAPLPNSHCQTCGADNHHLCFDKESCTHRLSDRFQLRTTIAGRTFRLFLLIIADDPELRRMLGCAGLSSDEFCPFCDLRRSQ